MLNCHPFQHGRYTFAHNGDIENFSEKKDALLERIDPALAGFVLGTTDSEVIFLMFLSELAKTGPVAEPKSARAMVAALERTIAEVRAVCDDATRRAKLTVVVSDGRIMVGARGGKELYWSTHKTRCGDREHCPYLNATCENSTNEGPINHLLLSSEAYTGENVWTEFEEDEVIGVDANMILFRQFLTTPEPARDKVSLASS